MARRPVKKRKPRNRIPATFDQDDAKIFDIPQPPMGIAYQWVLLDHRDKWSDRWVQVPFDRHADEMPAKTNVGGYIVYLGNILVQRDKQLVKIELDNYRSAAIQQYQDHPAYMPPFEHGSYHRGVSILSEQFIASSSYEKVHEGSASVLVDVTIPLRVHASSQDAASALGLSVQEYTQRSISLYIQGQTGGLMVPIDGAIELHQIYINDQMRK